MTEAQRSARNYHFRSIIAAWDMETKGPFVLSWREARRAWRQATRLALYTRR